MQRRVAVPNGAADARKCRRPRSCRGPIEAGRTAGKRAGSRLPLCSRLSRARSRSFSKDSNQRGTVPMMGMSSSPRLSHRLQCWEYFWRRGRQWRQKNTRASERGVVILLSSSFMAFDVRRRPWRPGPPPPLRSPAEERLAWRRRLHRLLRCIPLILLDLLGLLGLRPFGLATCT
jgi:hypothetical protein